MTVDGDATLLDSYLHIRRTTERLCAPLVTEDYVVQSVQAVFATTIYLYGGWPFLRGVVGELRRTTYRSHS